MLDGNQRFGVQSATDTDAAALRTHATLGHVGILPVLAAVVVIWHRRAVGRLSASCCSNEPDALPNHGSVVEQEG
jgi:hypothetical protein